jgi:biopolymer transport protein TolR
MGLSPSSGIITSSASRSTPITLAEINVTPLVDVMLVLLIVFMISAPLMQQGVQVDLPKANTGSRIEVPNQLI